jgi:hypothetical protein
MNCIWAEYNEHLDDTATVASMVGCWVNPSSLYDELVVVLVRLVSWLGKSFRNAAYVHNSSLEKWDGLLQGALRTHIQRFTYQRT